jgi:hypothetical protein
MYTVTFQTRFLATIASNLEGRVIANIYVDSRVTCFILLVMALFIPPNKYIFSFVGNLGMCYLWYMRKEKVVPFMALEYLLHAPIVIKIVYCNTWWDCWIGFLIFWWYIFCTLMICYGECYFSIMWMFCCCRTLPSVLLHNTSQVGFNINIYMPPLLVPIPKPSIIVA